jgi:phosphoglycolate phosphatase
MVATFVYDWNGTLLDDFDAVIGTLNIILRKHNRPEIGHEALRDLCLYPFPTLYRRLGFNEEEIETLGKEGNAIFHDNYELHAANAPLRKGAIELLESSKKNKAHNLILSNHMVDAIEVQLERLKIKDHFSTVLAFASREKQYKDISKGERLRLYMKDNGIDPATTIIIGDSEEECEIAHGLHLVSVAITGGTISEQRLRAANPDHLVHDFYELLPILQKRRFL